MTLSDMTREQLEAVTLELLDALTEIAKGEGAFSMDPLEHATNCIEDMKRIASEAIAEATDT